MYRLTILLLVSALVACATSTVRDEDLQAWVGQPVQALDVHPIFAALPRVTTIADDGTEIRNYINGRNIARCSGGGTIYGQTVSYARYNQFTSCMSGYAACNSIFYIKDKVVQRYTPIGTGGARCFTDARIQPGYTGPANI